MTMQKTVLAAAISAATIFGIGMPASAQGVQQTVSLAKVDYSTLTTGFRGSKVIGASVYNAAGDTIGKIDDIIISRDGKAPFAVISVGGFLGMGDTLVLVRYDDMSFTNNKITLLGGSKEQLSTLPAFKYAG